MAETKQRLSALDWQFLGIEDKSDTHMHIGSLLVFEGPPPTPQEFEDFVASRVSLAPRFRQRLVMHPTDGGKPVWAYDPDFRITEHIVAVGLPRPGGQHELERLTGEIFSHRLNRNKPLWRMWFVDGMEDNQWALVMKMHHAMVDGLGAIDLFAALMDFTAEPREVESEPYDPDPLPRKRDFLQDQARRGWKTAQSVSKSLTSMIANPGESGPQIYDVAKGMAQTAQAAMPLAPTTPLNVETGPARGYHTREHSLAEFKEIRKSLGGSINDVVMTITADALGRYLRQSGVDTDGMSLRAEVPSAVRTEATKTSDAGNVFVVLAVMMPVDEMTSKERYTEISDRMSSVKESGIGTAVSVILGATDFLPPTILAQTSRLFFSRLLFNLLISNVPGVQFPVYLNGSKLLGLHPLPWVGPQQALSVAVMSYNGTIFWGFMVDRDIVQDVEVYGDAIDASFNDLLAAAREGKETSTDG